jgi:hypothetical protein
VPYSECVDATGGRVSFIPIDMSVTGLAQASPATVTACWSTAVSMGAQPTVALMRAIEAKDWDRAKQIDADIAWANETFLPPNMADFAVYNLQIEKLRMVSAGYCKPGPLRPPYDVIPAELEERAYECGRRWAEIEQKYTNDEGRAS